MAAALVVASKGLEAYGALMQGQATANSLNAQADLQMQNAQEAETQGQYDASKQELISGHKIGVIRAGYGASGVSMNSGSVFDVLRSSASNAELDRLSILHGADVKSINYQNQASLNRIGAQSAIQGSYWQALGALGMGGANAMSKSTSADKSNSSGGDHSSEISGAEESLEE